MSHGPPPRRSTAACLALLALAGACTSGEAASRGAAPDVAPSGAALTDDAVPRVQRLQGLLEVLAADSMEGRRAGTIGEERAVRAIEAELARYGVRPAGTDGYRQPVPMVARTTESGRTRWVPLPADADADTIAAERLRTAYNVLGLIPGSDPEMAGEIVVVGAHHDHLGIGAPVEGDSIYNGADDDASGVVATLEIGRALATGEAPGRTVLLAFFTAEEMGLLGTEYWIERPTVDFEAIVADLQIEMIARPDSLAGGPGHGWLTGYERSTMGDILAEQGSPIVADPRPEMRFFFRSDNLPFARRGIPAHTLSSYDLHTDYHTPADEVESVDYPHMDTLVGAAIEMVRALATGPTPAWKEGGREGLQGG